MPASRQGASMHEYFIDPVAQIELEEAGNAYLAYFTAQGNARRGAELAEAFAYDYRRKIDQLKKTPCMYPFCSVYPFSHGNENGYRSFRIGWFTVFYTVYEDSFVVWHVRSSKSDFSALER